MEKTENTYKEIFKAAYAKAETKAEMQSIINQLTLPEMRILKQGLDTMQGFTGLTLRQEALSSMLENAIDQLTEQKNALHVVSIVSEEKAEKPQIRRFKVGQLYSTRSACDHNCIFEYKVTKRTDKSIWIINTKDHNPKPKRRVIEIYDNAETVYPSGKYSMAHSIRA